MNDSYAIYYKDWSRCRRDIPENEIYSALNAADKNRNQMVTKCNKIYTNIWNKEFSICDCEKRDWENIIKKLPELYGSVTFSPIDYEIISIMGYIKHRYWVEEYDY
jgi:hypothetical protein